MLLWIPQGRRILIEVKFILEAASNSHVQIMVPDNGLSRNGLDSQKGLPLAPSDLDFQAAVF